MCFVIDLTFTREGRPRLRPAPAQTPMPRHQTLLPTPAPIRAPILTRTRTPCPRVRHRHALAPLPARLPTRAAASVHVAAGDLRSPRCAALLIPARHAARLRVLGLLPDRSAGRLPTARPLRCAAGLRRLGHRTRGTRGDLRLGIVNILTDGTGVALRRGTTDSQSGTIRITGEGARKEIGRGGRDLLIAKSAMVGEGGGIETFTST